MKKAFIACCCTIFFHIAAAQENGQTPTPQWRPVYHFTPEKNWTNDPNGLIYLNGEYHLYNQQNPFENKWGHMSWGHATSKDLVHWRHLPLAMPETIDKDTTWRFSGCAVWDRNNSSGFCKGKGCLVAVYTADQPNLKKESQFVAYSNDGGMTFTQYANNPVIDLHKKDFRDPNVFWYQPSGQWLMTVALPAEHKLRFYGSPDLKSWNLLSEFGPQGYDKAVWECPFLIQLPVNGNESRKKWVLMVSSGGPWGWPFMQYFVGEFDGTTFRNDNPSSTVLPVDYGNSFYAAIPWNNLPENKKLYIGWLVPGAQPTFPWRGQMSVPRDLALKETDEGIRLFQSPAAGIAASLPTLFRNRSVQNNITITGEQPVPGGKTASFNSNSSWIEVEFEVPAAGTFGIKLAQRKQSGGKALQETVVGYDAAKQELYIDNSNSQSGPAVKPLRRVALKPVNGRIALQVLFDKSSLEVFANDGRAVITTLVYPDQDATGMSLFAGTGQVKVHTLNIWDLPAPSGVQTPQP